MNIEKISQYIKKHCTADDYSLHVWNKDSHETRFAQNGITQHIAGPKLDITLRVSFGTKTGSCTINQEDETNLAYLLKTAEDMARLAPDDPEFLASAAFAELPKVDNCDPATRDLEPKQMVAIVQNSIDKAKAMGATVSGMTEKHHIERFMLTKNGFVGQECQTEFGHSMTLKKGSVETKVDYSAKDFAGFSLDKDFARLAAQAEALAGMQSFEPQKIAVILRPGALQELMWYMGWMMNRRQSDEGFTPFTGQLGKPFFGDKFSWYSTLNRKELVSSAYSSEGVASQEFTWVENGVLKTMPTNRYWAKKVGSTPSSVYNVYIPGGNTSEEEMMQMVPRGLIINRFWYIRTVDAKVGELTGMTRDGVLYFENGKVKHAVNNLRFNEIPHDVTRRILALGISELASASVSVPTMLIDGFNFVDKTSF
ncbi:MAG: metallopeptidase TldD-related protein [Candidatus Cloacimonas sp.]|jgi:predicted Zn-dependent protease|nr:metallopeptidase TldD-related protein [Candidatus Cloacimonas sp.]